MIRLFAKSTSEAALVEQPPTDLTAVQERGGWVWIDVIEPTTDEINQLGSAFSIDPLTMQEIHTPTLFPKSDEWGDYVFAVLHGAGRRNEKLDTSELDFILTADALITFHRESSPAIEFMIEQALRAPRFSEGGPDEMFARIAGVQSQRYMPLIDELDNQIEQLEDRSLRSDPAVILDVQALRRDAIVLRRVIGPQREVLLNLGGDMSDLIGARARRRFQSIYDQHYRLVESLDASRSLLGSVLDTYRSAVAERMNEVMKVLTVYAAILLPLSLLAGIYGMNFVNIPELQWRWGYFGLIGLMASIAVGQWIYFSRRGFIGGPSLRRTTTVVGRGIAFLALAPVRTVGQLLDLSKSGSTPTIEPPDF